LVEKAGPAVQQIESEQCGENDSRRLRDGKK
jgi:hypothetical protein